MKGKYHIVVQNSRVKFEFDIKRNITIIRGDSATGKTTLMNLVETYDRLGVESGISISCEKQCKTLNNNNWENVITQSSECIIFIDEETRVIKTPEFAAGIKDSDNYYVIITRENLPNLPYSVEEIYGIHTSGRYADVRQTYNSFFRLYGDHDRLDEGPVDMVIAEDTNAGYDFFEAVVRSDMECISAGGKARIKSLVKNNKGKKILVIADGAAFGSEMNELYLYMQSNPEICLYLPESFEWIILSSGLIDGSRVAEIIDAPEDYIESAEFFSWEQFFTKLLINETQDTYLHYTKSRLNVNYLNRKEKAALLKVLEVVRTQLSC
jgi:hypothetical protein